MPNTMLLNSPLKEVSPTVEMGFICSIETSLCLIYKIRGALIRVRPVSIISRKLLPT
jgi:hypothetical protein